MTGYVRQSSPDIQPDEEITADPLNREFDAIQDAFHRTSGHTHDGTTGSGPKIVLNDAVTGTLPIANGGTGTTTATGILGVIKTVDGVGSGLDADTIQGLVPQSSTTDVTAGRLIKVGSFGLGKWLDLRTTPYTKGIPSDIYNTGTVVGLSSGGPTYLNISGLLDGTNGVLRSDMQYINNAGTSALLQTFSLMNGDVYKRVPTNDTTWGPWIRQPNNADLATINTTVATNLTNTNAAIATKLNSSAYTAADVLAKVKTVDGVGSGLDADLLQGQPPSFYSETASSILTKLKTVDGVGSGLDADVLDGMAPAIAGTANTIAQRDSLGYLTAGRFLSNIISMDHAVATRNADTVFYSSTDDYIRKNNAAGFKTSLALTVADVASLQSSLDAKITKAGDSGIGSLGFGTSGLGAAIAENIVRIAPATGNANVVANSVTGGAIGSFNTTSSTSVASITLQTDVALNNEWQSYGTAYAGGTRFSAGPGGTAFSAPRNLHVGSYGNYGLNFYTNNVYRGAFISNGYFVVGATNSAFAVAEPGIIFGPDGSINSKSTGTSLFTHLQFGNNAAVTPTVVGYIQSSGTTLTLGSAGALSLACSALTVNGKTPAYSMDTGNFAGANFYAAGTSTYGALHLRRSDGVRGAYIDGNGGDTVSITLDSASILNVAGGELRNNGATVMTSGNIGGTVYAYIAASDAGALGTYAFAMHPTTTIGFGGTVAGSSIRTSDGAGYQGGALSGSWRCMGSMGTTQRSTLFLRYA